MCGLHPASRAGGMLLGWILRAHIRAGKAGYDVQINGSKLHNHAVALLKGNSEFREISPPKPRQHRSPRPPRSPYSAHNFLIYTFSPWGSPPRFYTCCVYQTMSVCRGRAIHPNKRPFRRAKTAGAKVKEDFPGSSLNQGHGIGKSH